MTKATLIANINKDFADNATDSIKQVRVIISGNDNACGIHHWFRTYAVSVGDFIADLLDVWAKDGYSVNNVTKMGRCDDTHLYTIVTVKR